MHDASKPIRQALRAHRDRLASGASSIVVAPERSLFEGGGSMPCHGHPELFLQLGGSCLFQFPDGELELQTGDLCIMPIGVPHGETVRDGETPFQMLVLMYMETSLHCVLARGEEGGTPQGDAGLTCDPLDLPQVLALLRCCQDFIEGEPRYAHHVMSALLAITDEALRHPRKVRGTSGWSTLVRRCDRKIEARFADPSCNVATLAAELGCTPNYLSAKFRRETGHRLTTHLNTIRMQRACHLLTSSTLTVKQIARCTGHDHPSYFTTCFKRRLGQTPLAYRRDATTPASTKAH